MLGVWIIENDPKRTLGQNRNRNCSCQGLESEHIKTGQGGLISTFEKG
jgi:hypothetical protein